MTHIVFVYGTLKQGQPNNYFMQTLSSTKYLGKGISKSAYPLVVGPRHFYLPLLLKEEFKGKRVKGEVYEVDAASLEKLDEFEDHPNMYERFEIPVELDDDGTQTQTTMNCWTYFFKDYTETELNLDHLENYDSKAIEGQEYDIRENPDHPGNR